MSARGGILRRRVQLANVLSCEEHGPNRLIWMVQLQTNCEVYDDVASFHQDIQINAVQIFSLTCSKDRTSTDAWVRERERV